MLPEIERMAVALFRHQSQHCAVYREYLQSLGWDAQRCAAVSTEADLKTVPFLPVEAFKTREVQTGSFDPVHVFTSSGTTGQTPSRHLVAHLDAYRTQTRQCFEWKYGPVEDYAWLFLLPGYLERTGSSLVDMANYFMTCSPHPENGFFLNDYLSLLQSLTALEKRGQKTVVLGVTFALLDWAEWMPFPLQLKNTLLMETGGMKGRRAEPTRAQVHQQLKEAFGVPEIHSEYGMTELFSQAYAQRDGLYSPPPSLLVWPRDPEDPFAFGPYQRTAALNVIDLANVHSCAFLALQDLGRVYEDGVFEVVGRFDAAEIRGCSLLAG
jgi:phenylacetate-coenzyme A ligase PaaK-like adenylate-forming protein